jgi:protein-disulfide isomerase
LIHAPSLAIGAIIASITIAGVLFGLNSTSTELEIIPTPKIGPAESQEITMGTFIENGSPVLGDPNAPITIVEFGDYQCHYCNVFFQSIEKDIITNYVDTGKVKIIFKDYNIIGPDSISASHGAHCAEEQGLFWEYHDILYSNWTGENNGWASPRNLTIFADEINADVDKWTECMNEKPYSKKIMNSNNDARALELTGTPAFFIIDENRKVTKLFGAQPYDVFKKIFDSQLEK